MRKRASPRTRPSVSAPKAASQGRSSLYADRFFPTWSFAKSTRSRRARFTEAESGKAFATSSSSRMTLVPAGRPRGACPAPRARSRTPGASRRQVRGSPASYALRSRAVVSRALMILILVPRSVYATTRRRPASDFPRLRNRRSSCEWSGSEIVSSSGSPNTVTASLRATPCRSRVDLGLLRIPLEVHQEEYTTGAANRHQGPFRPGCEARRCRPVEKRREEVYAQLRGLGQDALPALARGLSSSDVQVRRNVALFLGAVSSPWYNYRTPEARMDIRRCLPELITALKDTDGRYRGLVAQAIGEIGADAAPAVPGLVSLLTNPDEGSRNSACIGLAGIGPVAKDALPALRAALADPSADVRRFAQHAIDRIEGRR